VRRVPLAATADMTATALTPAAAAAKIEILGSDV